MSPSASAQFLPTSKTIHAINSNLRSRSRWLTRNSRFVRSSTELYFQVSKAFSAACIAGSTSAAPAVENTPTTSDGLAGFSDSVFSSVFTRRPPITRSYSRPSSLRTFSMAERILRTFSGLLQSMEGSFWKVSGIRALLMVAAPRVPSRAGVIVLAISASSQKLQFRGYSTRCRTISGDAEPGATLYFTPLSANFAGPGEPEFPPNCLPLLTRDTLRSLHFLVLWEGCACLVLSSLSFFLRSSRSR